MFGVNIYQWYRFRTGTTVTLGLDGRHYGGSARKGGNVFADDRQAEEYAAYSQVRQSLFGALTLEAGLRVERSSRFGTEVIPQGGAVYRLTENHTIRASVSKGYRSPNIRELYMFPPANDQLQPESMLNYEAGMSHRLFQGKLTAQWGLFYSEGDNLIQTVTPPVVVRPQNLNVGQFRHKGVEASLRWTPVDDALFTAGYSYLWMERPMGFTPRHQLSLGGSYALGAFRLDADFQFIGRPVHGGCALGYTSEGDLRGVGCPPGIPPPPESGNFCQGRQFAGRSLRDHVRFPDAWDYRLFGVTLDL
jgi:iron complex outermembrane receptor protein